MSPLTQLIQTYYDAFNAKDMDRFLDLLSDTVAHDINQGHREDGKAAFRAFMAKMNEHYDETITDLVICESADQTRAAAEFRVLGRYLKTDQGLPDAHGQTYDLKAGAFFDVSEGLITRVTNYYNLEDWITQVNAPHDRS